MLDGRAIVNKSHIEEPRDAVVQFGYCRADDDRSRLAHGPTRGTMPVVSEEGTTALHRQPT
jgi:hypothetical protein